MNVTGFVVTDWNKDGTIVKVTNVTFDDGSTVPGYDLPPNQIAAGKPLPEGWEIATAKSGKPYIKVPKAGKGGGFSGGAAAFRNTKEGQVYEQERMDRRTALMQAVAVTGDPGHWDLAANSMYAWLRASLLNPPKEQVEGAAGAAVNTPVASNTSTASSRSVGEKPGVGEGMRAAVAEEWGAKPVGEGGSAPCSHGDTVDFKPDGSKLPDPFIRCLDCGKVLKA